jgi:hypothetical protein
MEREFVEYTEVLELKALGFDEPCFGFHSKIHGLMMVKTSGSSSLYKDAGECLAPTYSQAFRFFREKHGLFSEIQPYLIIGTQWRYTITNRNNSSGLPHKEQFETYEEAELECLIKLIDIVKKQNLKG